MPGDRQTRSPRFPRRHHTPRFDKPPILSLHGQAALDQVPSGDRYRRPGGGPVRAPEPVPPQAEHTPARRRGQIHTQHLHLHSSRHLALYLTFRRQGHLHRDRYPSAAESESALGFAREMRLSPAAHLRRSSAQAASPCPSTTRCRSSRRSATRRIPYRLMRGHTSILPSGRSRTSAALASTCPVNLEQA